MFYNKLFQMDSSLTKLLRSYTAAAQREKLVAMQGSAVGGLNNMNAILHVVQALGERHAGYGVTKKDYGIVAAAWNNDVKAE